MRNEDKDRIREIIKMLEKIETKFSEITTEDIPKLVAKVDCAKDELTNRTDGVSGCNLQYTKNNMMADEAYDTLECISADLNTLDINSTAALEKIKQICYDLYSFTLPD